MQWDQLAGGLGFEPRLAESESAVLPLDDPPVFHIWINEMGFPIIDKFSNLPHFVQAPRSLDVRSFSRRCADFASFF